MKYKTTFVLDLSSWHTAVNGRLEVVSTSRDRDRREVL